MSNGIYLLILTISLWLAYIVLSWLFLFFFSSNKNQRPNWRWLSVLMITTFIAVVYSLSLAIDDLELANRFLHVFGGGVMGILLCYLAVRDNRIKVNYWQFVIFSFLVVLSLGVANEILEFILQFTVYFTFSANSYDTWWDLSSNVAGALLALLIFTPLINNQASVHKLSR